MADKAITNFSEMGLDLKLKDNGDGTFSLQVTQVAGDGNPSVFSAAPVGAHTSVATASLATAYTLVKAAGATGFLVQNTGTTNIRWTNDGTNPTTTHGFQLPPNTWDPIIIPCPPGVVIKMIRESSGAALDYVCVK